jgi:hypothetical protein
MRPGDNEARPEERDYPERGLHCFGHDVSVTRCLTRQFGV